VERTGTKENDIQNKRIENWQQILRQGGKEQTEEKDMRNGRTEYRQQGGRQAEQENREQTARRTTWRRGKQSKGRKENDMKKRWIEYCKGSKENNISNWRT
jgi:hypothetical protein